MNKIDNLFANKVKELLKIYPEPTFLVFKGFAKSQIDILLDQPQSILPKDKVFVNEYLDLDLIKQSTKEMTGKLMFTEQSLVALYEELLVLKEAIRDLSAFFQGKIVIVENNFLTPWTPSLISRETGLRLFDYLQTDRNPHDLDLTTLVQHYTDVMILDDAELILPKNFTEEDGFEIVPFWQGDPAPIKKSLNADEIVLGTPEDWSYRLNLLSGTDDSVYLLRKDNAFNSNFNALILALDQLGIEYSSDLFDNHVEKFTYDDEQFLPILRKYWGKSANFRDLLFYKEPDKSRDTEIISQGSIIAEIVDQCEAAIDEDIYRDIFITAPTGAGKSMLFQLPALYLAEKYNLVTIVVSPLIALMNDQVQQMQTERGVDVATCINSTMSMEEREERIAQIHNGSKSLIYLAPELLLTTNLPAFLGGRKVGLFVIDEAHTVTSWGRDFRSDYWFLGDFLKKTERDGFKFPVLCLTATAVYSGSDDVVNDTIRELELNNPLIHLGNVRRTNIDFDIESHEKEELKVKVEVRKNELTLARMREYISKGEKVLTYFPYRRQVEDIYGQIPVREHTAIRRYHGQLPTEERKLAERDYKKGKAKGLVCTKAFGMGIDVSDIHHIIHFAPTGTLADYVQEIGRAARDPKINAVAHIDYFPSDLRYVRALNSISEMRQYQLKDMLKKIYDIYSKKKRRNLLIASETFEYLFDEKEVENKTKSGLMLLAKDLRYKYGFPVLIVRPKPMLSKNYVIVPKVVEKEFIEKYGSFAKKQKDQSRRIEESITGTTAVTVTTVGSTYLVNMDEIWEKYYPELTFGMFKKQFMEMDISSKHPGTHLSPRVRVEIKYTDDYNVVSEKVEAILNAIYDILHYHKHAEVKAFTQKMFEDELTERLGEKVIPHDKVPLLMDIFTATVDESAPFSHSKSQIRILQKRRQPNSDEAAYLVIGNNYIGFAQALKRMLTQISPDEEGIFYDFYPRGKNDTISAMPILKVLELLGLASYEIRGGEKAEVFIRINDPDKIRSLAYGKYTNVVLQEIRRKHQDSTKLLSAFFSTEMTKDERWQLIEEYFLGNERFVKSKLGIEDL